jgi:hypothetical protein
VQTYSQFETSQVPGDFAARPEIKVLFDSGYSADILSKKRIIDGDVNFITNPVSPDEFLKKVREVLDT